MNKKQKILILVLSAINLIVGVLLTIFLIPNKIPVLLEPNEKILKLGTKWLIMCAAIIPAVFAFLSCIFKNQRLSGFFKSIFIFSIYQNVLIYIVLSTSKSFAVGTTFPLSLSLFLFLPLSCLIFVFGIKLKTQPFNTFPVLWKKQSTATEFLWKQIHYFAKNIFMMIGLILFVISIIFAFFKLFLVELAIFVIMIVMAYLIVLKQANDIYKKYNEMKQKQDELQKQKDKG